MPEAVCAQQLETEEDASVGWRAVETGEAGSSLQGDTFGTSSKMVTVVPRGHGLSCWLS